MAAAIAAAVSAAEVELFGEDHRCPFQVEITRARCGLCLSFAWPTTGGEFLPSDFGIGGDAFETGRTKAAGFRKIGDESADCGNRKCRALAPTRAFVGFAGFESAAVWLAADRAVRGARADARVVEGLDGFGAHRAITGRLRRCHRCAWLRWSRCFFLRWKIHASARRRGGGRDWRNQWRSCSACGDSRSFSGRAPMLRDT